MSISHCSNDEKSWTPPRITLTKWDAGLGGCLRELVLCSQSWGVSPSGSGHGTILAQVGFQHPLVLDPLSRAFLAARHAQEDRKELIHQACLFFVFWAQTVDSF